MCANLHIFVCLCLEGVFDFGSPAINPSINLSCIPALFRLLSLCRLDLSQLFASFKDKEILIELLCNSTSQCITRQLDINRPGLCVRSSACMCLCVLSWGTVFFLYPWLKAFPLILLEAAVICLCRLALYPLRSSLLTHAVSMWVSTICVFPALTVLSFDIAL